MDLISSSEPTAAEGPPSIGLEANKRRRTPAPQRVGEESTAALANTSSPTTAAGSLEEMEIVRATMRLAIEPWRLIDDGRHLPRTCAGGRGGCSVCATYDALDLTHREATSAFNLAARMEWRADADALDALRLEGLSLSELVWPARNKEGVYTYPLIRRAWPELASGIAATISSKVARKHQQTRSDVLLRQIRSPMHYVGPPIPVPRAMYRLSRHGEQVRLSCSLGAGGTRHVVLPLVARDERQRQALEALISGEWRAGELMLERDKRRAGRWYLRVSYTRRVARVPASERVAALNRGILWMFAAVTHAGEEWPCEGTELVASLAGINKARRQRQRQIRRSKRTGRGIRRALHAIKALEDRAQRWRASWNQTFARRLGQWLAARRISTLYREDFRGIRTFAVDDLGERVGQLVQEWPYHDLGSRIDAVCAELGITVVVLCAEYISQTCPVCRHVAADNMRLGTHVLHCQQCGFRRHLDVVAAMNLLARGRERSGGDATTATARRAAELEEIQRIDVASAPESRARPRVPRCARGTARGSSRKRPESGASPGTRSDR